MNDFSDYAFQQPAGGPPDTSGRFGSRRLWSIVAGATVLVAAIAFYYFVFLGAPGDEVVEVVETPPAAVPDSSPVDNEPSITLPPLDDSDSLVRTLARVLLSHPRVAAWLATDGLIRNFTVVVENISNGQTPIPHLLVWKPEEGFGVIENNGSVILDTRSYARYADVADAIDGIDPTEAARLYATLKPRIQEAYVELGYQQSFDIALERAIVLLLRTPVTDEVILLESAGALWAHADSALENLAPAQKQLIRMGPRSARRAQAKLREIALAIGVPDARLQ
jgi:hypothetical protein